MSFKKYPSIENTYREKTIKEIKKFGFDLGVWVVTNKVHGANFSFWCDGENVLCAKRNGFLKPDDNFYGFQEIASDYKDRVIKATLDIQSSLNDKVIVVFYGEIFGGSYPHPDVSSKVQGTKVQKGVYYCPMNDFYLFDITFNGRFMTFNAVEKIGKKYGFIYAESLFMGSFEDCLNFDPVFEDPLYKVYGFPKIENNMSEGIVLKPVIPAYFPNGSRCILKNKNPSFNEKTRKKKKVHKEIPVHLKEKIENISMYVTENRLKNVLSHSEKIGQKEFGKLMKFFVCDIIEDYEKDNGSIYNGIEDKKEKKVINKALNKMCSDLIRPNFQNIIDGEF
jgi:Rnl2 family RNA ligase